VPALFADEAYSKSSCFQLSTSNMSPGRFGRGGFAPVTDDGYGLCYIIQDGRYELPALHSRSLTHTPIHSAPPLSPHSHSTIFNLSARGANVNLRKFGDAIDSAMEEVLSVLQHK